MTEGYACLPGAVWSSWLDIDHPGGSGDFETTYAFRQQGKLPCKKPSAIQCQAITTTKGTRHSVARAPWRPRPRPRTAAVEASFVRLLLLLRTRAGGLCVSQAWNRTGQHLTGGCTLAAGIACRNSATQRCMDYQVRFACSPSECAPPPPPGGCRALLSTLPRSGPRLITAVHCLHCNRPCLW